MEDSPTGPRSKRQKIDKGGRFAALARLKELKGAKNKLQLDDEVDNVYDIVEESEYEKMVQSRADDDWIEDDGTGYVEDGREIFDDDGDDADDAGDKKSKPSSKGEKKSKKRLRDINAPAQGDGNIKRMFGNAANKVKSNAKAKLAEDDILTDILGEMDTETSSPVAGTSTNGSVHVRPSPIVAMRRASKDALEKKRISEFMQGFTAKASTDRKMDKTDDDALIDEMLKKPKPTKPIAPAKQQLTTASRAALLQPKEEKKIEISEEDPLRPDVDVDDKKDPALSTPSDMADMDYSILDDEENQFDASGADAPKTAAEPTAEKSAAAIAAEATAAKLDEESDAFEKLVQNWENTCSIQDSIAEDFADAADEDFEIDTNDDAAPVRFWFWDAWEDAYKCPGQIFLFGKIAVPSKSSSSKSAPEYKSACIKIENIDRCLYLLPREFALDPITKRPTKTPVKFLDVYNEFNETIAAAVNVTTFRSRKISKNFAYTVPGVAVPATCDYLEVRYEGNKKAPSNAIKYNTVAHIFGTNTNNLETFLLESKIKGPCWLNITRYTVNKAPQTWCKHELTCPRAADCISVCVATATEKLPPTPPLVLVTLNVQTALNPRTTKNEVCLIAGLVNRQFSVQKPPPSPAFQEHFCAFTRPAAQNWPADLPKKLAAFRAIRTHKLDSERALLSWFLATWQRLDADLVCVHDADDCQLDAICDRITTLKIPLWSRLGRLRLSVPQGNRRSRDNFIGRMVCDVKMSAEELIKSRGYDLETLCHVVLKMPDTERIERVENEEIIAMYGRSEEILRLITLSMQEASFVLRLMCELNVLPLALQITTICGNLMGRTLSAGRNERNEWLLLHAFVERNYIVPDRRMREMAGRGAAAAETTLSADGGNTTTAAAARRKPQFSGGMVLEPLKGYYDKYVLLMDFNSLYPSIIQEYNICFTTIEAPAPDTAGEASETTSTAAAATGAPQLPELPDSAAEPGILPRQIRRLVESRREVKKLMASPDCDADLRAQYNVRQTALKLTANSMYGCLGFPHSRFYAQHLAALVTFKGREILLNTKSLVQKLQHQVIYGDTDSIMINTNSTDYEHVMKIGTSIKQAVNKMYRQVELDIDGVFKCLLLLKKKKYAAVTIQRRGAELLYAQEHKGLDIVRRDWSQIAQMAGRVVLDELLNTDAAVTMDDRLSKVHAHLERFRQSIEAGTVPESLLTITKQLTKAPGEYAITAQLPHVQVALRMNAERNRRYKKGDMVAYVICVDGTDRPATQRAYHLDELKVATAAAAAAATATAAATEKATAEATEPSEKATTEATEKSTTEAITEATAAKPTVPKIDVHYYLAHQLHPIVTRLCEQIEGTDAGRLATCLGLDATKFKAAASRAHRERAADGLGESVIQTSAQRFRDCERFTFKCPHCGAANLVASAFRRDVVAAGGAATVPVLEQCSSRECGRSAVQFVAVVRNQLVLAMRAAVRRFYENWLVCDEPNCSSNTRWVTHVLGGNGAQRPVCVTCKVGTMHRQYGERDLFAQLSYYQYMFDLSKHENLPMKVSPETQAAYACLADAVDTVLNRSAFGVVKLSKLFPQPISAAALPSASVEADQQQQQQQELV